MCLLQFDEFLFDFQPCKNLVKLQLFKRHHKYLINVFDVCVKQCEKHLKERHFATVTTVCPSYLEKLSFWSRSSKSSILADFRLSLFDGKFYVKRKPLPEHLTQHQQKVFISTALSLVFKYFLPLSCLCSREKGCLQEKGVIQCVTDC